MLVQGLGVGRVAGETRSPRASAGAGAPFPGAAAEAAPACRATVGPAPLGGLAGVLAAQEVMDRDAQRRRAARRGGRLLAHLEALHLRLLEGGSTGELQQALSRVLHETADRADRGGLADVIGQIELRAAVELAKLEPEIAPSHAETRR